MLTSESINLSDVRDARYAHPISRLPSRGRAALRGPEKLWEAVAVLLLGLLAYVLAGEAPVAVEVAVPAGAVRGPSKRFSQFFLSDRAFPAAVSSRRAPPLDDTSVMILTLGELPLGQDRLHRRPQLRSSSSLSSKIPMATARFL